MNRLSREKKTVEAMIGLFCRGRHGSAPVVCASCAALTAYAFSRIDRCPFGASKPACSRCAVHCYKPDMQETIRRVMRYSGPRMPLRHPLLTLWHLGDFLLHKQVKRPPPFL
jgi:hypothetical protein